MDWGTWSPTHTALVIFAIVAFIGQVAVYFYRTAQNDKKIERQGEELRLALKEQGETLFHAFERLEERMDKRLSDMQADTNARFTETNQRLSDMQAETNHRLSDMQAEIRDVRIELSKLNQNHIEHLTHHN